VPPVLRGRAPQPVEPLARLSELRIVVPCLPVRTGLPRTDNHSPVWFIGWPEELPSHPTDAFLAADRRVRMAASQSRPAPLSL
jgi:hypothetical protein